MEQVLTCMAKANDGTGETWTVNFDRPLTISEAQQKIREWNRAQTNHKGEVTYYLPN
jgi:hypothetical protein